MEECRAAREVFRRIGASREAERAERLLAELDERRAGVSRAEMPLTRRESEVLRLVAEGFSDKEIAGQARDQRAHRSPTRLEHPHEAAGPLARRGGGTGHQARSHLSAAQPDCRFRPFAPVSGRWQERAKSRGSVESIIGQHEGATP
jgi:Bacterial regulatory proteins, luxR family